MNRELLTIIESLCKRIVFKSYSGLEFIETKPEMCRIISLRVPRRCEGTSCCNCYFSRSKQLHEIYTLYLEKTIQRI